MKTLLILVSAFVLTLTAQSQTVNDFPINDLNSEYVTVSMQATIGGFRVYLNYGQKEDFYIKGEFKEDIKFNSTADVLNFMSKYGYELIACTDFFHFIMKKKSTSYTSNHKVKR